MAFPTVQSRTTGTSGTSTTSHSIPAPAGVVAGDVLLVFWATSTASAFPSGSPSGGYTELYGDGLTGIIGYSWFKTASGSDTLTFSTAQTCTGRYVVLRVSNASGVVSATRSFSSTATGNSNPPSHTPAGGAQDYLWVAARAAADSGPSAAPAGFSNLTTTPADSGSFATSEQTANTTSMDPGNFTSSAAVWLAYTIAVAPAVAVPTRLYLQSETAPAAAGPVTVGSPDNGLRSTLGTTKSGAQSSNTIAASTATAYFGCFISPPLAADVTISTGVTYTIAANTGSGTGTFRIAFAVIPGSGATSPSAEAQFSTSMNNVTAFRQGTVAPASPVTVLAGQRLIVVASAVLSAQTAVIFYGGTGATDAAPGGFFRDPAWVEFPETITFAAEGGGETPTVDITGFFF